MRWFAYLFIFTLLLFSCKPSVPGEYIQPGDMEDILYDYHLAMSMAEINANDGHSSEPMAARAYAYKLSVFKKYGVTEEQFDNSMKYYMRNTERLYDIYESLSERLEDESAAMGTGGEGGYRHSFTANGDSADIWTGERNILLLADAPFNRHTFTLRADTSFHKGDRLHLSFNTQYIVQEGSRDAVVVLCVRFANDSIASLSQRIGSNSRQTLTIVDHRRVGIKNLKGFMLFNRGLNNSSSTLKLLFLKDIQFLKVHTKEPSAIMNKTNDSLKVQVPKVNQSDTPRVSNNSIKGEHDALPRKRMLQGMQKVPGKP